MPLRMQGLRGEQTVTTYSSLPYARKGVLLFSLQCLLTHRFKDAKVIRENVKSKFILGNLPAANKNPA